MSNTTSTPTNNNNNNFEFYKYITLTDLQNVTNNIFNIICANTLKENRSLSFIEASEIVVYIFRNDRFSDYIVGNIWKNSHLNINQNENTLLHSPPNPNN
jgi:hypothetical protein